MMRPIAMQRLALLFCSVLLCLLAAGCSTSPYDPLPSIERQVYQRSLPEDPSSGTELAWRGSRKELYTFWGKQDVLARVRTYLPDTWNRPGDGIWRVRVQNAESKPVPFLGVVRQSEKKSRIVPSVDLEQLPDGLYSLIIPGVEKKSGQIVSVMPRLMVCEIRKERFQPFRIEVPLYPLGKSSLTGPPQKQLSKESNPQGTPYPFSIPQSEGE